MNVLKRFLIASSALALFTSPVLAEPKVVASIKPVHSLVSAVMGGIGNPVLLVGGASSPHNYSLKPSQAASLQESDLVFWIGHELETFLAKPVENIAATAKSVELIDSEGLVRLEFREGHGEHDDHAEDKHGEEDHAHEEEGHDDHAHDDHAHDDHSEDKHGEEDHAHEEEGHDDHAHEEHAEDGHDDGHGHAHGGTDPHIWLDPQNAKAMALEIAKALSELDPENASAYAANATALQVRIDKMADEVGSLLEPLAGRRYAAFHDAYQYFEKRFGLGQAIAITLSPEVAPGAQRVGEVRGEIGKLGEICVFSEPQFEPKLVATVTEGTTARTGQIDPLGANIEAGPELYFSLLNGMTETFQECLSSSG